LIRWSIIPDAQRTAIAIIMFLISSFPFFALPVSPPEEAISTPPAIIPPNDTSKIIVVRILISPHISLGKALVSVVTFVS
jgi:magnesium-transporting ATPase (P-type)